MGPFEKKGFIFDRNINIQQKTGQNEMKDLCPAGLVFYLALARVTGRIILELIQETLFLFYAIIIVQLFTHSQQLRRGKGHCAT